METMDTIIVGTWPISGDYGNIPLSQIESTLCRCYEKGIREFDTAPNYGNGFAEFALGNVFFGVKDVLMDTKVGNIPFTGKSFAFSDIEKSVEQSLKRLKANRINTLYLHNPRQEIEDYSAAAEFLNSLKQQGVIRYSGISCAKGYAYPQGSLSLFDRVQNDVSLLHMDPIFSQKPDDTLLIARSPLASGLLSGRISKETTFPSDDHRSSWLVGKRLDAIMNRIDTIKSMFPAMDILTIAMRFIFSVDGIGKAIFGVKKPEHIDGIVEQFAQPRFSKDDIEQLINLYQDNFNQDDDLGY